MVTNQQVRRYLKLMKTEKNKVLAAAKSGMDIKTTRKYEKLGKLPSEVKKLMTGVPGRTLLKRTGMK